MTDYNDGKWHGWNGGKSPLHPNTLVDLHYEDGRSFNEVEAGYSKTVRWMHSEPTARIVAFRVTKQYKEPREFWILPPTTTGHFTVVVEVEPQHLHNFIHVREVQKQE